jgi:uncharacterized membrane protein
MFYVYKSLVWAHIFAGSLALLLFWAPMLAAKGSSWHRQSGRWYANLLYIVSLSGMASCLLVLLAPMYFKPERFAAGTDIAAEIALIRVFWSFLALLSVLSWVSIRQAVLVVQAGPERVALKSYGHLTGIMLLLLLALYVGYLGWNYSQLLLQIFSAVALFSAISSLRYIYAAEVSRLAIIREHLGAMLGSGIAIYTAFTAFGGRQLLSLSASGQLLSWLLPSVIGVSLIFWYSRKYQLPKKPNLGASS